MQQGKRLQSPALAPRNFHKYLRETPPHPLRAPGLQGPRAPEKEQSRGKDPGNLLHINAFSLFGDRAVPVFLFVLITQDSSDFQPCAHPGCEILFLRPPFTKLCSPCFPYFFPSGLLLLVRTPCPWTEARVLRRSLCFLISFQNFSLIITRLFQ